MKLGFLILSASKPEEAFLDLLEYLNRFQDASIWIHHDFFQAPFPQCLITKYKINLVKNYYKTAWSHINNLLATITSLNEMFDKSPDLDWVITLTPNCFPIIKPDDLLNFFSHAKADAFIDMHMVASEQLGELDKFCG